MRVVERIVCGCRAVVIQSQHESRQMSIVRFRSTKLIVRYGTKLVVLQRSAAAVIAHQYVKFAVRTEAQDAAIVIAAQRLIGIGLVGVQSDEITIKS